jgi:hypothetical protein
MTYKQPYKVQYHVFTNNYDDYTADIKEALKMARRLYKEYGCVRVYEDTTWNADHGIFEDGECIYSKGGFPA